MAGVVKFGPVITRGHTILFLVFTSLLGRADDRCLTWFTSSGIKSDGKDCVIQCDILLKDMSAFTCANRCEEFCKSIKCEVDEIWEKVLRASPDPLKALSREEAGKVKKSISRLPKSWRPKNLKSIGKMSKPIDFSAILSPAASTEDRIILYNRAFTLSESELTQVFAHEVVHLLIEKEWAKQFLNYK